MSTDTCDHVDDVSVDEEGVHDSASKVESCPDFKCNPECHAEILAKGVKSTDPDEYLDVSVNLIFGGRIDIGIVTKTNFTQQEAHERIQELTEDLQELNDEMLGILDADFYISFMYPKVKVKGTPDAFDEQGNPIEFKTTAAERALDETESLYCPPEVETATGTYDEGAVTNFDGEHLCDGCGAPKSHHVLEPHKSLEELDPIGCDERYGNPRGQVDEPEECPICGSVYRGKSCGACGYKDTSEDWRE
jgi:hypothetical protein